MAWYNEHANGQPRLDRPPDEPPKPPFESGVLWLAYVLISTALIWTAFVAYHTLLLSLLQRCTAPQITSTTVPWLLAGSVPLLAIGLAVRSHTAPIARMLAGLFRKSP